MKNQKDPIVSESGGKAFQRDVTERANILSYGAQGQARPEWLKQSEQEEVERGVR